MGTKVLTQKKAGALPPVNTGLVLEGNLGQSSVNGRARGWTNFVIGGVQGESKCGALLQKLL